MLSVPKTQKFSTIKVLANNTHWKYIFLLWSLNGIHLLNKKNSTEFVVVRVVKLCVLKFLQVVLWFNKKMGNVCIFISRILKKRLQFWNVQVFSTRFTKSFEKSLKNSHDLRESMRKFTWDTALFFKLFACLINVSFEEDVELYDFNFQETQEQVPDIILANKK